MTKHHLKAGAASVLALLFLNGCGNSTGSLSERAIPQPLVEGLPVADDSARIDLNLPSFSNSTNITNPLFPISSQESVVLAGIVDGKAFRTEVTLLPYTRIIEWGGVQIEAAVSQYVAFLDGRITESAIDLYAQADDGSVWYLGEDVADFRDGIIITNEGTWHAGIDAPPAMIMPGQPRVGNVYRTENMPGIAFEEVTVRSTDETFQGPFAAISGGMIGGELHADGATEDKQFAPRYGEYYTSDADGDYEALALAVPVDRAVGAMPQDVSRLSADALAIFEAADEGDWRAAAASVAAMNAAWGRVQASEAPRLIRPVLTAALDRLSAAVAQRNAVSARNAAIEAARWSYDLQLRYRPAREVDLARLNLWAAQLEVDAAAGDEGAVKGDVFTMVLIKDRIIRGLDPHVAQQINLALGEMQSTAFDDDVEAASEAAGSLREILAELTPG